MATCAITNDDGIDAPGLRALYGALRGLIEVVIVAPAVEWSGSGHGAPSSARSVLVERRSEPYLGNVFVVHSHPADCVRLALSTLLERRPAVVVAGINRGGNVGVDAYYSGTVAAAREAAILGCSGIAVSQLVRKELPDDWDAAERMARQVLEYLLPEALGSGRPRLWNVNLPHLAAPRSPSGTAHVPLATTPLDIRYVQESRDDGRESYRYAGAYLGRARPPGSDVDRLFDDWVTISEMTLGMSSVGSGS